MPRRNWFLLLAVVVVSLVCHQRTQRNRYGRVLGDVISKIENSALEPVHASALFEAAMDGMVGQLDEYSGYIRPTNVQSFYQLIDQEYSGIGIQLGFDPNTKQPLVLYPLPGLPAHAAGIRDGDLIVRINNTATRGLSAQEAMGLLMGDVGSDVTLTVLHEGEETPIEIKITRAKIQVDTVRGDTRNADGSWNFFLEGHDRVGYIRIVSFTEQTRDEMDRTMAWLIEHDMQGLVLDLRDDPGGLLPTAVDFCDRFIKSGPIVSIRRRDGRVSQAYDASGTGKWTNFPMAALVNGDTASASEIVAACLQDHRRAIIVGQRTYGKGTVQELINLEDGCGAMKLTTASYWRPSGKNIHRLRSAKEGEPWGVQPDEGFNVVMDDAALGKLRQQRFDRDAFKPNGSNHKTPETAKPAEIVADPQLARAVDCVEQEINQSAATDHEE